MGFILNVYFLFFISCFFLKNIKQTMPKKLAIKNPMRSVSITTYIDGFANNIIR